MGPEIVVFSFLALFFLASPVILLVWLLMHRERMRKIERSISHLRVGIEDRLDTLEARLRAVGGDFVEDAAPSDSEASAPVVEAPAPAAHDSADAPDEAPAGAEPVTPPLPPYPEPAGSSVAAGSPPEPALDAPAGELPPVRPPKRPRSDADWEELIGGNWLNKLGVVLSIIGIALLLDYSWGQLGPAGRVGLGLAVSAAMLVGGAVLESRERYRIAARGLIGGGWAGFYFTTFAMHGVEAARVIDSPIVGTGLLLAVAVGMVLHSMLYRSETVTALAYFVTFVTLAITPASRFALFASVPAAASLLYIGRRFKWTHMMVAGIVFTYGAYIVRAMSPNVTADADFVFGASLLFAYWVMFEAFDLMSHRGPGVARIADTFFPINAAGFLLASLMVWDAGRREMLWLFFILAAIAYTASAVVRVWLHGMGSDEDAVSTRIGQGAYEGPAVLAVILLMLGIGERLDGWQQNVAWLLQSQLIILSGLTLRVPFLRHLGSVVLVAPVTMMLLRDLPSLATIEALGREWGRGTLTALLTAGILYIDRVLLRRGGIRVAGLEHVYSWFGTLLIAAVLALELPEVWFGAAWLAFGLALIAYSRRWGAAEVFLQGYVLVGAAWFIAVLVNVPSSTLIWGVQARWVTGLPMVPVFYALAYLHRAALLRVGTSAGSGVGEADADADPDAGDKAVVGAASGAIRGLDGLVERLDLGAAVAMAFGATFLTSWFLLSEVSGRWLTVAWGLQGVALLAVGIVMAARGMRLSGLALLVICVGKVFFYDLNELETIFKIASSIILGALLIGVSFAYSRYREQIRRLL